MKKLLAINLILVLGLLACKSKQDNEKRIEEIDINGNVADIIRNPASAEGPVDTVNVAKMAFTQTTYNFGEVSEGELVKHTFEFTNTGKVPLIISDARSTCGCTVPEWPEEPVAPGEKGKIEVVFNTAGKMSEQSKPITITANTYPSETVVTLEGFVRAKSN
ncbi:MAG: DUF1573 domain-containing protein [Saprospiraceae bacterium]